MRVCGHSLAGIGGSNPSDGLKVSLVIVVCCQIDICRRADLSYRGFLPIVVRSRNPKNEAALARVGLLPQEKRPIIMLMNIIDYVKLGTDRER